MMLRLIAREGVYTAAWLVAVTACTFGLADLARPQDWFGGAHDASALGLDPRRPTGDLPLFWNADVADARIRTSADIAALDALQTRAAAEARLARRGSAAIPTMMTALPSRSPDVQRSLLRVLAVASPALTGGDRAPVPAPGDSPHDAIVWWDRVYATHLLDFRPGYAERQAERLASRDSRNAVERVARLGTYGLPALVAALDEAQDAAGLTRVSAALSDITGRSLRVDQARPGDEARRVARAWRAFWVANRLEYETLSPWRRGLGHFTETRYGQWFLRAVRGDFGESALTRRAVTSELQVRLPASTFASGIGGLLAVAVSIAFGGGEALRRRALRVKMFDLLGALVPGSAAFAVAWFLVLRVCARGTAPGELAAAVMGGGAWVRATLSAVACGALAAVWFQRPGARIVLQAVRVEAEQWVSESLSPTGLQVIRHGARIGAASLLAPMGIAAPVVLLASLLVEVVFGLRGMGELTLRSLAHVDGPWLMAAVTSVVPLLLARRWALGVLAWLLGVRDDAPAAPPPGAP